MHTLRLVMSLALIVCSAGLASGCAEVRFNQKGKLSAPAMTFDHDPLAVELRGYVITPREAAMGGFDGAGAGGCGCY